MLNYGPINLDFIENRPPRKRELKQQTKALDKKAASLPIKIDMVDSQSSGDESMFGNSKIGNRITKNQSQKDALWRLYTEYKGV